MHILLVGINYKTAPVELRECFSIAEPQLEAALARLRASSAIAETVIVSTCNRTEVYTVVTDEASARHAVYGLLEQVSRLRADGFRAHTYVETGQAAVLHLHRVVCGLDSMVIGETQILGQVRQAFLFAQASGSTGPLFNQLFRRAVTFGKRVQTETGLGQSAVSVSYAAVSLAKKVFDRLDDKTVVIIGAGKMSELTLTHLAAHGVEQILVVNRTHERARQLAAAHGGQAIEMSELPFALKEADIVISSTGSQGYVLSAGTIAEVMKRRKRKPLFCIDIAVPRDIDPDLAQLSNVYLYDIDDLQDMVAANVTQRKEESVRVMAMIEQEARAFAVWLSEQEVVPLIAQLRDRALVVQQGVMESLAHKFPELDDRQRKMLQKHTMSIVNQLLREPIASIKEMAGEPGGEEALAVFARIFALSDESSRQGAGAGQAKPRDADAGAAEWPAEDPDRIRERGPARGEGEGKQQSWNAAPEGAAVLQAL
ncbi:MAG: glutamyl-tRNA reductase [Bacilli bacterium]